MTFMVPDKYKVWMLMFLLRTQRKQNETKTNKQKTTGELEIHPANSIFKTLQLNQTAEGKDYIQIWGF